MAVLGRRHWYRYDSDDSKSYRIQTLDYLAEAAGLELNDNLPTLPRGYEPRYVWLQEAEPTNPSRPLRKKLILPRRDAPLLRSKLPVEVAGIKMNLQGYVGETRRGMGRNDNVISEVRVELSKDT
jgi:hypothetical protein